MSLRYFKIEDFDCKHTGKNEMHPDFLDHLDELRHRCGIPFVITSGYRDPSHPIEAKKPTPGTHTEGIAADIAVQDGWQRGLIVQKALEMGCFNGIGVAKGFVHVDTRHSPLVLWTY